MQVQGSRKRECRRYYITTGIDDVGTKIMRLGFMAWCLHTQNGGEFNGKENRKLNGHWTLQGILAHGDSRVEGYLSATEVLQAESRKLEAWSSIIYLRNYFRILL